MSRFRDAFPASYREDFSARTAVYDLQHIGELDEGAPLSLSLYRLIEEEGSGVNLKLFHQDAPIPLSDVLPMMENLGLRVIGERPYEVQASDASYWIHDFTLEHHTSVEMNLQEMRGPFIDAFQRIWQEKPTTTLQSTDHRCQPGLARSGDAACLRALPEADSLRHVPGLHCHHPG